MAILLLADHDTTHLSDQTAKALTAATKIGGDVHVLIAGSGVKGVAEQAAKLSGVAKVLVADDASLANNLAEPLAALIVSLAGSYDTLIAAATSVGKNVMPRVAALLDVAQVSEIIEVVSADTYRRPIYAGNAIQTVQTSEAKRVITVRTASFAAAGEGGSAVIESVSAAADPGLSSHVSDALSSSDRPELTSAKIIISGGRALGSSEKFKEVILPVADKLGAAVGASRARRRCRLCAERLAGRPDRQGGRPRPLHRLRHFRRHPAPRRHEGFEGDRRHQQGRGGADLPGRRLRPRRRSLRRPAGAREGALRRPEPEHQTDAAEGARPFSRTSSSPQ
ncbi:electron transfer flavoprotein alpha subunit [Sinorhizobium fredii]